MSNERSQYNGQNGNGYQPLHGAPTPPPGPEVGAPTLAEVQPGGKVRLGDQSERARFDDFLSSNPLIALCAGTAWQVWQAAISAQPSPGGQDALAEAARRVLSDIDSGDYHGEISEATYTALEAALAARQPVGEPVLRIYAEGSMRVLTAWLDGARDLTDGDHLLYVAPPAPLLGQPVVWVSAEQLEEFRNGTSSFGSRIPARIDKNGLFNMPLYDAPSQQARPTDDELWDETLSERDRYHEVADELADHIARITGVDIGEHSSANCPWQNAIEAAEEYKPAQAVDLGPRPMNTAPRDGTMVRLLVLFDDHATEDRNGPAWTIGVNTFQANGENLWQFAGWCWTHDHFTEGKGTPVGWLPMTGAAQAVDLDELRRAVCVVGVVGQIDGHDVVRRNSVLDVIDVRRQRQIESQAEVSRG